MLPVLFSQLYTHLDAASQNARGEFTIELGILLTLCDQVTELRGQQELRRVLVQDFGEGFFCSQAAKHYCIVFMHQSQAMQEAGQLLNNLNPEKERKDGARQAKGRLHCRQHSGGDEEVCGLERMEEKGTGYRGAGTPEPAGSPAGSVPGFFLPGSNYPSLCRTSLHHVQRLWETPAFLSFLSGSQCTQTLRPTGSAEPPQPR